tara:strand:- start:930 stop:2720 length:1791 start_codon:yes stop_codon:yes gene_type:complete
MCGFLGKISSSEYDFSQLENANIYTICRGPDIKKDTNFFYKNFFHSYVFNRLSILDLSSKADQPMANEARDKLIMFNGEIYNHEELRDYLISKGCTFLTSHSDTEVVLNGLSLEGVDFINKLRGQFSIFFLDKAKNKALLIRDRLGQKPLYYKLLSDEIIFGSNLKSLLKLSGINETISQDSLNEYIKYGAISSPRTIFNDINKVSPGCYIEINLKDENIKCIENKYWDLAEKVDNKPFQLEEFWKIFRDAVILRLNADVPVANFLSGGIDSSTIVKILNETNNSLNTFTVTLDNKKYDDSYWAEIVSEKYNTNHKSVSISNYLDVENVEKILTLIDEPYADPSIIPSFVISKEISNFYKVAISGDGGDELLGGYVRTGSVLENKSYFRNLISKIYTLYPAIFGTGNMLLRNSRDFKLAYKSFLEDNKLLSLLDIEDKDIEDNLILDEKFGKLKALFLAEYNFYLPEMMMFKVDRTSMANSLEVRSPFVDHLLVEYVISHNLDYDSKKTKKILKDYLSNDFSSDFINRKKQGFIFDLEKFIYTNFKYIESRIQKGDLKKYYKLKNIKLLRLRKSRINANRLWKLYVVTLYLDELRN